MTIVKYHFSKVVKERQVGKTTLLRKLAEDDATVHRTFITLDDLSVRALAISDPALFFQRYQGPFLIDEIQYAPELLGYIKILVDQERTATDTGSSQINGRFWLTGSQVFTLMRHVSESLAGRIAIFRLQSLSNAEVEGTGFGAFSTDPGELLSRAPVTRPLSVAESFSRILRGGMPALVANPSLEAERFFSSYIQTYLQRDIRDLTQVADELLFLRFLQIVAARTATPLVFEDIAREVGISSPTAKKWVSLLLTTGIVTLIPVWSSNALKRIIKTPRLYFLDTGLCAHLLRWSSAETLEAGPMSGAFFETWVVSEIFKSFLNAGIEPPLYYYRDKEKREIDLLIHRDGLLHPVEIKKTARPDRSMIRHFAALNPMWAEAPDSPAAPSTRLGAGALICQVPDLIPLDATTWCVPVGFI